MTKLLKTGIFGIVCAMTMMNVAQVKADLNEDYQAIKAAIEERDLLNKNILSDSNEWRADYKRKRLDRINELKQKLAISEITFGQLKAILKDNEYLSSVDQAIAMHMPDIKRDEYIVAANDGLGGWFTRIDIPDNDWTTNGSMMAKGTMGISVWPSTIHIFSPSAMIECKEWRRKKLSSKK